MYHLLETVAAGGSIERWICCYRALLQCAGVLSKHHIFLVFARLVLVPCVLPHGLLTPHILLLQQRSRRIGVRTGSLVPCRKCSLCSFSRLWCKAARPVNMQHTSGSCWCFTRRRLGCGLNCSPRETPLRTQRLIKQNS